MIIELLDNDFERVAFMSDDVETDGIYVERATATQHLVEGVYTLDFIVPLDSPQAGKIREGQLVGFQSEGKCRLLTITETRKSHDEIACYCEDAAMSLLYKTAKPLPRAKEKWSLAGYVKPVLEGTDYVLKSYENDERLYVEGIEDNYETGLKRLQRVAETFNQHFYFETILTDWDNPQFNLVFVSDKDKDVSFSIDDDEHIDVFERRVDTSNLVTKLYYRAKETKEQEVVTGQPNVTDTDTEKDKGTGSVTTLSQSNAKLFDSSKTSRATSPISTAGWSAAWIDRFRMDAADPAHVTGAYIDDFLRRGYPDSPLIGYGKDIKEAADYWGISVGAFLGQVGKETTFGRNGCGGRYNFGCITHGSWTNFWPRAWASDRYWINPPNVRRGIYSWFYHIRKYYVDKGQRTYRDMLNKYAPAYDSNDHNTFKNIMWGVVKAFGYDVNDTVRKKDYSGSTTPDKITLPSRGGGDGTNTSGKQNERDEKLNKMIKWFQDRRGKVGYSQAARLGPNSYDCSSAVYFALQHAGIKTANKMGYTGTLWYDVGPNKLMTQIKNSEARRGDIFLTGAKYEAGAGNAAHTGVYLSNTRIIHCTLSGCGRGIIESGLNCAGTPLYSFRINDKALGVTSGGSTATDSKQAKREAAADFAVSRVRRTPYVWGGASVNGWDCSGMVQEIFRRQGWSFNHRVTTYSIMNLQTPFKKITRAQAQKGDLAITNGGGHVEVLLQEPSRGIRIVHAASPGLGTITQNNHVNPLVGYYRVT